MKSPEETIKGLIASAKAGNVTDHVCADGKESWKIPFNGKNFRVEVIDRLSKKGEGKSFNKTNLYLINDDGKESVYNLGQWKKKLFYTLMYNLRAGKIFHKIEQDPVKVMAIKKDMKENPSNYVKNENMITGSYNGKQIVVNRSKKSYPSGKTQYKVTLTECGVVTLRGSQLNRLFK